MARAVFKSWLVDFDPVRAKAEGRPTGLTEDLAAFFPASFNEDGLPLGWTLETVGEMFEVSGGNTPSTAEPGNWGGPHQWATPKDLSSLSSPVLLQTERHITDTSLARFDVGAAVRPKVAPPHLARQSVTWLSLPARWRSIKGSRD